MSTKTESSSPSQLPRPRSLSLLCVNRLPVKKMDPKAPSKPQQQPATQQLQSSQLPQTPQTPQTPRAAAAGYLHQLLPGATEWPHSDEALAEALKLRQEQERTKQEFYRLENRKRTLEILTMATQAGVPGNAIASLFEGQQQAQQAAQQAAQVAQGASQARGKGRSRAASPEVINYEDAQNRSPTRFRPAHTRSASAITSFPSSRPITQAYYPRQVAPPSSSLQFHHWKPNQRQEDKRKTSPKQVKHEEGPSAGGPQGSHGHGGSHGPQGSHSHAPQGSHSHAPQGSHSHGPSQASPSPAPAAVVAAAHQQNRRSMHSRHRSEAAIPVDRNWYNRQEEGASILASMATDRAKHDVGYILAPDRSPYPKMTQSSPPQQSAPLPRPQFGFPGPVQVQAQGPQATQSQGQAPAPVAPLDKKPAGPDKDDK